VADHPYKFQSYGRTVGVSFEAWTQDTVLAPEIKLSTVLGSMGYENLPITAQYKFVWAVKGLGHLGHK
jgi:hypothetical protein